MFSEIRYSSILIPLSLLCRCMAKSQRASRPPMSSTSLVSLARHRIFLFELPSRSITDPNCPSNSLSSAFDDLIADSVPPVTTPVPALHVILALPASKPAFDPLPTGSNGVAELRKELIEYLAGGVGGDMDAAEWVLLALLARM
jgi:hypothetical protein